MMNQYSSDNHRYWIYFAGLVLMAIGLSLSKFLMSVAEFFLAANWLADKEVLNKFKTFFRNKSVLAFSSIMLIHFIGLIYSNDFSYAWLDIRIKAPLLILPVIISTSPVLQPKHFHWLMGFFIAAVVVSSLISTGIFFGI